MNSAKIVIVGAGPSGIAAATKLLELGFQKVYLVEAENRIGGRIHTIPFADNVVDLGAQWCMGEKNNVVYEIVGSYNLLEPSGDILEKFASIRSNKEILPNQLDKRLKAIIDDIVEAGKVELVGYEGSLASYVTKKFFAALQKPENSDIDMTIAKEFFEVFKKIECSSIACDNLEEASGKGQLEYIDCEGDAYLHWKDKGYKTFLNLLIKSDETGNELGVLDQRVIFGKRVKTIIWNDGEQVKLKCEDNDEILADHVITTVSLGVLKEKHSTLFEPNLPPEKVRAIEKIGFGTINKVIIEFPSKILPDDWCGFTTLWREEDLKEIRGTNRAWLEDLFIFDYSSYRPRCLFGWMIGRNGRHMEELSEDEVLDGCMYLIRRFLKSDIPTPLNFKRSAWYSNENFRGSYSFHSTLTDELKFGADDLAEPLKNSADKPVVLFAGEATSAHHFGTVHGAVETGRREAERLAKFYENATV